MKPVNKPLIIRTFLKNPNFTQQQIAAVTGFSKTTVQKTLTEHFQNNSMKWKKPTIAAAQEI